jgi:hypothetical protein
MRHDNSLQEVKQEQYQDNFDQLDSGFDHAVAAFSDRCQLSSSTVSSSGEKLGVGDGVTGATVGSRVAVTCVASGAL